MINSMLILKGIIIGMIVCIPVGPLGLLSVQRSIKKGQVMGLLSGIGAATSDLIYCTIAIFGASYINDTLEKYTHLINEVTGTLFLIVGIGIILSTRKNEKKEKRIEKRIVEYKEEEVSKLEEMVHSFTSTFLMGLSNPMTFFIFITIFTNQGIDLDRYGAMRSIAFIMSVFIGSCLLWVIITNLIKIHKKTLNVNIFTHIDRIIGIVICLFGILNILKKY